jgi:putative endonuclease
MERGGYVYILSNKNNTVLYTGVTSNLLKRIHEHKSKLFPNSFSSKYNINKLVYYNGFSTIDEAILEEKRIKGGSRLKKIALIESMNPQWDDLFEDILK